MTANSNKRGQRMALWDEAFAQDDDGTSELQRELVQVIEEVALRHGEIVSREIQPRHQPDHRLPEYETGISFEIQPSGVKLWLDPDFVSAEGKDERQWIRLESDNLSYRWSTPSDFIADFRQALDSLLTDGDYEFRHRREQSFGEKVGEVAGGMGCLAVLLLLYFTVCGFA